MTMFTSVSSLVTSSAMGIRGNRLCINSATIPWAVSVTRLSTERPTYQFVVMARAQAICLVFRYPSSEVSQGILPATFLTSTIFCLESLLSVCCMTMYSGVHSGLCRGGYES